MLHSISAPSFDASICSSVHRACRSPTLRRGQSRPYRALGHILQSGSVASRPLFYFESSDVPVSPGPTSSTNSTTIDARFVSLSRFNMATLEDQIIALLTATLSSIETPRKAAELQLLSLYHTPGFALALGSVGSHVGVPLNIRQAAPVLYAAPVRPGRLELRVRRVQGEASCSSPTRTRSTCAASCWTWP